MSTDEGSCSVGDVGRQKPLRMDYVLVSSSTTSCQSSLALILLSVATLDAFHVQVLLQRNSADSFRVEGRSFYGRAKVPAEIVPLIKMPVITCTKGLTSCTFCNEFCRVNIKPRQLNSA